MIENRNEFSDGASIDKWGAEAILRKSEWLGYKAIKKIRLPKKYRVEPLDKELRKTRTLTESKLLISAKKSGIRTPYIFELDLPNTTIVMEEIDGNLVKDVLDSDIELQKKLAIAKEIGYQVGKLHNNEIIHGDLTTSNIIENESNLIFIDFGLGKFSSALEDKAVDILLMKKCFISTHTTNSRELFFSFQEGYKESISNSKSVFNRAIKVEARGRHLREDQLLNDYLL
ncbi:MAG: Kae1-associated serine/threonine protein kinase [Candidatus Heimdallarchaeota archaeon]|nr:Kae1-associated serine/threonine protein kinase [Candidatus Heimdallarchaeota archaeon]